MKKRSLISILLAAVLILSLASCASSNSAAMDSAKPGGNGDYDYGYDTNAGADYDDMMSKPSADEESVGDLGALDAVTETARKRIQYVTITMESLEYEKALSDIKARAESAGGYIESSSESGKDVYGTGSRTAKLVFRIPAEKLSEFSSGIESAGNILSLETDTKDVTESYFDIEARLASLEAQRERYMELLEKANTMDEILIIDKALSEVLYQIESYTGTLNKYDALVAYSTVTLTLHEVIELTEPEPIEEPTFGERISDAFSGSVEEFGEMLEATVIGIVAALPFLVIPAVIAVVVIIVVAAKVKRRRVSKEAVITEKTEGEGE